MKHKYKSDEPMDGCAEDHPLLTKRESLRERAIEDSEGGEVDEPADCIWKSAEYEAKDEGRADDADVPVPGGLHRGPAGLGEPDNLLVVIVHEEIAQGGGEGNSGKSRVA